MFRLLVAGTLTFLAFFSAVAQSRWARRVDSTVQATPLPQRFNGVILIAQGGRILAEKAYGWRDFQTRQPLKKTDLFELASVSKQFTAMVIMMLHDQGKLGFDDPLAKYVEVPYPDITIRHLLQHTSGLPDYQAIMEAHWDKNQVAGNAEILDYLRRYAPPRLFAPGERYTYSNTGYVLLALVAEKAGGMDFTAFCHQRIFGALGMRHSALRTPAERSQIANFARGHIYVAGKNAYWPADSFPAANYTIWLGRREGPGRISSTAQDLLRWDRALYTEQLVKAATLAEAFAARTLNDGRTPIGYGFGWDLTTDPLLGRIVQHNGDNPGYKTKIVRCIDVDKTIILLSNNAYPELETLANRILQILGGGQPGE